jgi:hypothetical protein
MLYCGAAGAALASATVAVGISALLRPSMGAVVLYLFWPFMALAGVWVVAGIARLRLVGFLPGQPNDDDFIPRALQPWIRFWLLSRFGLFGGMLVLLLAIVVTALAGRGVNYCAEALVYVVMPRMFMDLGFGAALNFGIITRRRGAG